MVKIFDLNEAEMSNMNVIISGGGLAGLSTSLSLVKLGYSVGEYISILYLLSIWSLCMSLDEHHISHIHIVWFGILVSLL